MTEIKVAVSEPADVDEAREAIERSRERISETLGAIEDRLVDAKDQIRDRVDVLKPVKDQVRTRPWMAVAVAAGVGAAIGGVLGGTDDDDLPRSRKRNRSGRDDEWDLDRYRASGLGPGSNRSRSGSARRGRGDVPDLDEVSRPAAGRMEYIEDDELHVLDDEARRHRRDFRARRRERLRAENVDDGDASLTAGGHRSVGRSARRDEREHAARASSGSSVRSEVMRAITGAIKAGLRERLR